MTVSRIWFPAAPVSGVNAADRALLGIGYGGIILHTSSVWTMVSKPTTAWSTLAKPTRGAAPDGFIDDSGDGFFARPHTDGFFASDGTWVPVGVRHTAWSTIPKPS